MPPPLLNGLVLLLLSACRETEMRIGTLLVALVAWSTSGVLAQEGAALRGFEEAQVRRGQAGRGW